MYGWLREGGTREDDGAWYDYVRGRARPYRHFHDPLRPWDTAGLSPFLAFFSPWESAVRWTQATNQDRETGLGDYSWVNARTYFRQALTAETSAARDAAFAQTFRALGQVMHLLTDMSVPEHVRDDRHPIDGPFGYEGWVLARHRGGTTPGELAPYLQGGSPVDPALFALPPRPDESIATSPIARLFDSDRYEGATPDPVVTTESLIGLAEVTNANFFSLGSATRAYPHPARATLVPYAASYDKTGTKRIYYQKPAPGLAVTPVLVECVLDELADSRKGCGDDAVFRATAQHLLPRAVRYSAALLDYFFRGRLEFEVRPGPTETTRVLVVTNKSPERMAGTVTLYADDPSGTRAAVAGAAFAGVEIAPGGVSAELPFTPPAAGAGYVLVFQGTLGGEAGAVVGKVQPKPVFAVQEVAVLTGEARPTAGDPQLPIFAYRFKVIGQQRASGHFERPGESDAPSLIAAVRMISALVPSGEEQVRLWLADAAGQEINVGTEWFRAAGPSLTPTRWRIEVDLPVAELCGSLTSCLSPLPLPRFVEVETSEGATWRTPLVWWWQNQIFMQGFGYQGSEAGYCLTETRTSTEVNMAIFFGDGDALGRDWGGPMGGHYPLDLQAVRTGVGFVPTQGILGYSVGTLQGSSTEQALMCPGSESYCRSGSYEAVQAEVFAATYGSVPVWQKHAANLLTTSGNVTVAVNDACPVLNWWLSLDPPPLSDLAVQRVATLSEQVKLESMGVALPTSTVLMKSSP